MAQQLNVPVPEKKLAVTVVYSRYWPVFFFFSLSLVWKHCHPISFEWSWQENTNDIHSEEKDFAERIQASIWTIYILTLHESRLFNGKTSPQFSFFFARLYKFTLNPNPNCNQSHVSWLNNPPGLSTGGLLLFMKATQDLHDKIVQWKETRNSTTWHDTLLI